jgi:hypothetical protein
MRYALLLLALVLVACPEVDEPPLGMILVEDGVTYAGVASVDITPVIAETFTDLNGNNDFNGCLDDPTGTVEGCDEPFDDADGDGWFDATFIGGFGPMRPANDVHDPIYARALVLAQDGAYIALVGLDLVGIASPRTHAARDRLVEDGFAPERLIVAATHNHQGPDTMGLWGNPMNLADPTSGIDLAYNERVTDAIEQAVRDAAGSMEAVDLAVGTLAMRDRGPSFNGARFGGHNPDSRFHGMIHDGRDPVVVSDQLLVIQGTGSAGVLFTYTNWSGHPETRGGNNNSISADWVGETRRFIEARYGGIAVHMPESLGGMQSALSGDLALVLDDGTHVMQLCGEDAVADPDDAGCFGKAVGDARTDDQDRPLPVWAERDSWEFVTSHGWHIAEATFDVLEEASAMSASPIRADVEPLFVPVENLAYQLLGPSGIFDLNFDDAIYDPVLCPWSVGSDLGCIETWTFRAQVGPVGFVGVPGELLPELARGFPEHDPQWLAEVDDPTARGAGAVYFSQHDHDCDALDYAQCQDELSIGDCDCLKVHAWPYVLSADPAEVPLLSRLDTEYTAILGMADDYISYIIPEPDFNSKVSLLSDSDGDHYEDTVSPAASFATSIQQAQARIDARW